ncbi:MAG: hypothetical protein ACJ8IQ_01300, partial [Chthoniobacterales bacterium]
MYGVTLQSALGEGQTEPILPFTSQIFLNANALIADANVRYAQFFHRTLPFALSSGVPYSKSDKVVANGKLFQIQSDTTYNSAGAPPTINTDPSDSSSNANFRYIGPRAVAGVDYYNYQEPADPNIVVPAVYPAPPPGDADLVILTYGTKDEVYQVTTAGRLDPKVYPTDSPTPTPTPAPAPATAVLDGIVEFQYAGGPLNEGGHTYTKGDLVVSNGRVYEVVQGGTTANNGGLGLTQTDGEVAILGTAAFNFIPTKVLREQIPYWVNDLVVSNGNAYRVTIAGSLAPSTVGGGLHSTPNSTPDQKRGHVTFQHVGTAFDPSTNYPNGAVVSSKGRIYKVVSSSAGTARTTTVPTSKDPYVLEPFSTDATFAFELVVPQFQRYTEINSSYAGKPLQESAVYHNGDVVVSNRALFQVVRGGTMGPVVRGGTGPIKVGLDPDVVATQTLGGLQFVFLTKATKQTISNTSTSSDVPFPYSSLDYSFPYSLKWNPAETIANHFSSFGRYGYFETYTNLELFVRTTDSKDRTNASATVPISILPPIDARAALEVEITQPVQDRVVAAGTAVRLTADVRDVNGVVRSVNAVQFFVDGIAFDPPIAGFPYSTSGTTPLLDWIPLVAGTHIINAVAVDDKGNYSISKDVRVNVTDNQPFVRITTADGSDALNPLVVSSGETILIQGIESGSGGDPSRVTSVDILSDGNAIGTATPGDDGRFAFPFVPSNASDQPINYQITARVTDKNGATATSNTVYLQVSPGPIVSPTATPSTSPTPKPTATPTATPNPTATPVVTGRLANISTRGPVGVGTDVMVAGFINQGGTGKIIAIRGLGPSMAVFGVADAIQDPTLSLRDANGNELVFNDDYSEASADERKILDAVSLRPTDSRESAIVARISSGTYTCILQGKDTGVGLIEIYDLASDTTTRLLNLSTRGQVKSGDAGAMIGGFIIQGTNPQRVVIRAIGPSLKNGGVADALEDPTLDLYRGSTRILSNDNWKSDQEQELESTGIAPTSDKESAIVTFLDPGSY